MILFQPALICWALYGGYNSWIPTSASAIEAAWCAECHCLPHMPSYSSYPHQLVSLQPAELRHGPT